ncbi:glutathione binding-like protein [Xenorhabdus sp. IM139775]|uniref:glutathione binding-like protein n=1 Tax=Xenorhabdus sp. IM139775 TaxID=3025876 RepID=UPI002359E892|nr:glutathione binding-like protein [Xenorhabdus sp. IM139775]MDC9595041.1 glutathione binding-like protein [Xenorhabdus sp. IM139775]
MLTIWGRKNSSNVKKVLWCLEELNVPYQQYLSGDKFGMADIALAPLAYLWLGVEIERPSLPNLERWYQLLTERPAFKKIVMIEIN